MACTLGLLGGFLHAVQVIIDFSLSTGAIDDLEQKPKIMLHPLVGFLNSQAIHSCLQHVKISKQKFKCWIQRPTVPLMWYSQMSGQRLMGYIPNDDEVREFRR
jgi:hypothetical protein